jgi:hypothetical protein
VELQGLACAWRQLLKGVACGPWLVPLDGKALGIIAKIPHHIDRTGVCFKGLRVRGIFNAVAEGFDQLKHQRVIANTDSLMIACFAPYILYLKDLSLPKSWQLT